MADEQRWRPVAAPETTATPADQPASSERLCFVIMPFGGLFDEYYRQVIAPAVVTTGLKPVRSDEIHSHQRRVVEEIRHLVKDATICIADVTGRSPNVFYELGLADGLDRSVVLLAQSREEVPAELEGRRVLWYRPETVDWASQLHEALRRSLEETLADVHVSPRRATAETALGIRGAPLGLDVSLADGEELFRDLLADGLSAPSIERLLIEAGLPASWVRLRVGRLGRSGW